MRKGNLGITLLFLLMFTVAIALVLNNVKGSVTGRCSELYDISEQHDYSAEIYNETVSKFNECESEGWSDWYYVVFITPIGVVLAVITWHLAKPI